MVELRESIVRRSKLGGQRSLQNCSIKLRSACGTAKFDAIDGSWVIEKPKHLGIHMVYAQPQVNEYVRAVVLKIQRDEMIAGSLHVFL